MERLGEWARGHRRALQVSALVVAVLALVAVLIRDPVHDAWLSHRACDGLLAGDDLDTVRTGARLEDEKRFHHEDLGQYRCVLENTDGKVVVAVDAYTRPADQRKELSRVGQEHQPRRVLPDGLPGFAGDNGDLHLMPRCPRLGKDLDGQPRRMLATTWVPFAEGSDGAAALLRMAVKMTNEASKRLGCGAAPLPAPRKDARAEEGRQLTRAAARGTACAALAEDGWLAQGASSREARARQARARAAEMPDPKVVDAVREHAPVGRCTLTMDGDAPASSSDASSDASGAASSGDSSGASSSGSSGDPRSRQSVVELTSWHGDWGGGTEELGSGGRSFGLRADGSRTPESDERSAWATARCDGQNVDFGASWGHSYGDRVKNLDRVRPRAKSERAAALRTLVAEFAKDRTARAGCSGLKLPGDQKPGT